MLASTVRERLTSDHQRLEALCTELSEASRGGMDPGALGEVWTRFATGLRLHLRVEEDHLFPALREGHGREVDTLLAEHDFLRARLNGLDVEVDLHAVRDAALQALLADVRAHANREDHGLYRWADSELDRLIRDQVQVGFPRDEWAITSGAAGSGSLPVRRPSGAVQVR